MKELLEPLLRYPGVCQVALVSRDGVPVAVPAEGSSTLVGDEPWRNPEILAALVAAWMEELKGALGGMSWDTPRRVQLRAARCTLLLLPTSGAVLAVVIERGGAPEQLWLPMAGAAGRIRRVLRAMGSAQGEQAGPRLEQCAPRAEPGAALPSGREALRGRTKRETEEPRSY